MLFFGQEMFQIIVVEGFPHHILIILIEGFAVVVISPAITVGVGITIEHGQTAVVDCHEVILLFCRGPGTQADKPIQGQTVQRLEIGNLGKAQVQVGQTVAAG